MRRSRPSLDLFLLVLLAFGPAATLAAQPYLRHVAAFTVRDAEGAAYTHPWLGGFNVPRPQFVDIDGDADPDLFVQERAGRLTFFENTGTPSAHRFTWRTDAYADLAVGEWARLADIDGDGDFDVLAEEPFSYVRVYRNAGTPADARFVLAVDTLKATYLAPGGGVRDTLVFSDRQNLPALADIDCDGDPDLFVASLSGFLTFYENQGLDEDGLPALRFVTDSYQGIEIIGDFGSKRARRHGANAIAFTDVDADGDQDLFWGDFFSPSLYFLRNDGTCQAPAFQRTSDVFPLADPLETSGYNTPALADIDGDGDADLFVGVQGGAFPAGPFALNNFYFFRNDGGLAFALAARQFISSLDVGQESMPAVADIDGDGDPDLLVGNKIDPVDARHANLFFFRNEGTARAPAFRLVTDNFLDLAGGGATPIFNAAPAPADIDGDGDVDVLVGGFDGKIAFFRNDGTPQDPRFVDADADALGLADVGQNSTPALADIDGDGDVDLLVGESAGTLNFFRNVGTARQPAFVLETETYAGLDAGTRSAPTFVDTDGDGKLDLVVGTERGGLVVLRNTGTRQAPSFAPAAPLDRDETFPVLAVPAFLDVDGDGDADLFSGGLTGGVFFYFNARISLAVEDPPKAPRVTLRLLPNHPNPFRTATTIAFRLMRAGRVRIVVYDVLGRAVAAPLDGFLPPGEHHLPLDARPWPAGLYFYTLRGEGGETATRAMLRLR